MSKQPDDELEIRPYEESEAPVTAAVMKVAEYASKVQEVYRVARFRGRPMVLEAGIFPHFVPLRRELFDALAYPILGGLSRSKMADVFAYLSSVSEELTECDHLILFGDRVWNMRTLKWEVRDESAVWRSPFAPVEKKEPLEFIMQLAGDDVEVYDDIMQSIAPLVMETKPDGVIWWVGDGANGKSTLMDALYRVFPGQFSSLTVKRLTDGRDTPSLNGTLANVVKETSEGRVEDTEIYKALGTHEDFRVHKFYSQDDSTVRGNLHHIFSANNIPLFNDKGFSARRRTFVIPFRARFESDPTFEGRTFNPEMFGRLIAEMCRYAVKLRDQRYRYKWSAVTAGAKTEYDTEANSADEFSRQLIHSGIVAFDNFGPVRLEYENWCVENGYPALGVSNMRRAIFAAGFKRSSHRDDDSTSVRSWYILDNAMGAMQSAGMARPGMYTLEGFTPAPVEEKDEPVVEQQPKLENDW